MVKKSLVDRKVEYDTPAKQKHLVCVNTVKDLSESTRSVAKSFYHSEVLMYLYFIVDIFNPIKYEVRRVSSYFCAGSKS